MTIYAADALEFKPVVGDKKKRVKKATTPPPEPEQQEERKSYAIKQPPTIPKKPLTEKQIAGRAKAAETRRIKKEALVNEGITSAAELKKKKKINAKLSEDEGPPGETDPSKGEIVLGTPSRPAKRKNNEGGIREPRKKVKKVLDGDNDTLVHSPAPMVRPCKKTKCHVEPLKPIEEVSSSEEQEEKKPVKQRKQSNPKRYTKHIPDIKVSDKQPAYLEQMAQEYIQNQVRLSGLAKPKKQIKQEAKQLATSVWNDPLQKQNIQQKNSTYMKKMYASIFPNSKFVPDV